MHIKTPLIFLLSALSLWNPLTAANTLTSRGITWTFSAPVQSGTFVTGDPWVIGPVQIVGITNDKNDPNFTPRKGQNGSMVNPLADRDLPRNQQGYDDGLTSYREELNAALPNGKPISPANPLKLPANSTLVSTTSWLYNSRSDAEPGTPGFNGGTKAPRPVTRSASVLTVVEQAPPPNSFRPPVAGNRKDRFYKLGDVKWERLKNLKAPANAPDADELIAMVQRPWIDHVFEYLGAMIHPSEHMPNYGRDMGNIIADATLLVNTDLTRNRKQELTAYLIQYGIDSTGIADFGGGWRANGGHGLGRKWPILFAGILLDDAHMLNAGHWDRTFNQGVEFQEDQNHFYVSEAEVKLTNSFDWNPDHRDVSGGKALPYTSEDIGMPEWGIRHAYRPEADNKHMNAVYRQINGGVTPGFALAAHIMGARTHWNHEAFFDYQDRFMAHPERSERGINAVGRFVSGMWERYRKDYPPIWSAE